MNKSTLIALVVFAALAGAVVWSMGRAPERGISRISFAELDAGKIDRLEIAGPNPVKLKKDGDLWRLEDGKEADEAAVKRAAEAVAKVASSDLVTRSAERFAELEVDEAKGTRVQAFAGSQQLADFVVGKAATGGAHVRVGDEVYAVKQVFQNIYSKPAATWLERRFFKQGVADAARLEVRLAGQTPYAMAKKDGKWGLEDASLMPQGFAFDANAAASLAGAVAGLRAKDIIDPKPGAEVTKLEADFDAFIIAFAGKEGEPDTTAKLRLGAAREDDKSVFAMVEGRDTLYVIPEGTAKSLRKSLLDLRDLAMMSLETGKAKRLTISSGKDRTVFEKKDGAWTLVSSTDKKPEGFELDPQAVERRVSAVASARAARVADGAGTANTGLAKPSAQVTVELEGGKPATLVFGNTTKNADTEMVYARGNAAEHVYFVTPWLKSNLTGGLASFRKQAGPPGGMGGMGGLGGLGNIDPNALQNLPPEVRASLMQQLQQKQREQELIKQIQAQQAKQ